MPNEAVTIYVTKDAPTKGIRRMVASSAEEGSYASVRDASGFRGQTDLYRCSEWHRGLADAAADAEARRTRRIASLEKRIAAIRAIDLTKPVEG